MKIGRKDFDKGHRGNVLQAVWKAVPEDEAVDESELRAAYDQVNDSDKPSFEDVLKDLASELEKKDIDGSTYYIHRLRWLSSGDVAHRLGVSKRTVQSWAQQGKLQGQRIGHGMTSHRRIRFAVDAVDAMLHRHSVPHREEQYAATHDHGADRIVVATSVSADVWDNLEDAEYDRV